MEIHHPIQTEELLPLHVEQTNGQDPMAGADEPAFTPFSSRFLSVGICYNDLVKIQRVSIDWVTFARAMGDLAKQWKQSAERAWKLGRLETPREQWKRAADYYHCAQLNLRESLLKKSFQHASQVCYQHAAGLLDPPAVRCQVPFRSVHLPGYLRIKRPGAPCVILIGGLDTAKEVELHYFAEIFLRRSCSVFYFDGPGQGELYGKTSMECGFEHVVSAVIDFLRKDSRVGVTSIGCFGVDLGAHLACRATAHDPRVGACISVSGFHDSSILQGLPPERLARLMETFGFSPGSDPAQLTPHLTLSPFTHRMHAPLLLVHGTADSFVEMPQVMALRQWASGSVDTLILEGSEHLCCDRFNECLPTIGDWMVNWLLHRNTQQVALI